MNTLIVDEIRGWFDMDTLKMVADGSTLTPLRSVLDHFEQIPENVYGWFHMDTNNSCEQCHMDTLQILVHILKGNSKDC